MRILKALATALVGLTAVLLAISALLPGQVVNSRSVMVAASTDTILAELRDLSSWSDWNLLLQGAGSLRISPPSEPSGRGADIRWRDARGGENTVMLQESSPNGIVTEMRFGNGDPMESGFSLDTSRPDSVQVHWYVIEQLDWYPWEKFYGMMSADMKDETLRQSLIRLRDRIHRRRRGL